MPRTMGIAPAIAGSYGFQAIDVDLIDRAVRRTDWAPRALSAAAVDLRQAASEGESVDGVAELTQREARRTVVAEIASRRLSDTPTRRRLL